MKRDKFIEIGNLVLPTISNIKWYDQDGILSINESINILFHIENNTNERVSFHCIDVKIYSKKIGVMCIKSFYFRNYMNVICVEIDKYNNDKVKWDTFVGSVKYEDPTQDEINNFSNEVKDYITKMV